MSNFILFLKFQLKYHEFNKAKSKANTAKHIHFHEPTAPRGPRPSHYQGFTITFSHTALCRTPLD